MTTSAPAREVLFLHGWLTEPDAYTDALAGLRDRHAQVHAPALPGHARRTPIALHGEGALPHLADEIMRDWQPDAPAVIIGHSLGAGVAIQIALRYPEQVDSLLLVTPIGGDGDLTPRGFARLIRGSINDLRARPTNPQRNRDIRSGLRHPVYKARLGLSAKRAHLSAALTILTARGLPIHVATAHADTITVPLPTIVGITYHQVTGTHNWPIDNPHGFDTWLQSVLPR